MINNEEIIKLIEIKDKYHISNDDFKLILSIANPAKQLSLSEITEAFSKGCTPSVSPVDPYIDIKKRYVDNQFKHDQSILHSINPECSSDEK